MNRSLIFKAPDAILLHQDVPPKERPDLIVEAQLAAVRQINRVYELRPIQLEQFDLYLDVVPVDNTYAVMIYVSDQMSALVIGNRNIVMQVFARAQEEGGRFESLVDDSFCFLHNNDLHLFAGFVLN